MNSSRNRSQFQQKDLFFLELKLRTHIYSQLKKQPYFGKNIKKLKGYTPDLWRYRIGKFRLFFMISETEKIVYILTIDQRKDTY